MFRICIIFFSNQNFILEILTPTEGFLGKKKKKP